MDVRQYFYPVDFSVFSEKGRTWKFSLGQVIEKSTAKVTVSNLQKLDVAIVGVPVEEGTFTGRKSKCPDKIRSELVSVVRISDKIAILLILGI